MFEKTKIFAESWNVAWRRCEPGTILKNVETPFTVIKNSLRFWAADPFLFEHDGKIFIFAELYDYIRRRGTLGYCIIEDGKSSKWRQIIVEKYHLSYPHVIKLNDEIYIMPESSAENNLYLYKSVKFPDQWKKEKILRSNIKLVDTSPFEWEGKRLALTYHIENTTNPELYLLDFDCQNNDRKVVLPYEKLRRPAGQVIEDLCIRPAQNCTDDYGQGIIFYHYNLDNDGNYTESEIKKIYPENIRLSQKLYLDGMHTYNSIENYEVIDIKTRRFNLINLFFRIFNKIAHNF